MKKKIFMVMAVSWLIFSFCSCGNNTNTKNVEISEEQVSVGSRNNPYHIGDTIELSNITPYLVGSYEDVSCMRYCKKQHCRYRIRYAHPENPWS